MRMGKGKVCLFQVKVFEKGQKHLFVYNTSVVFFANSSRNNGKIINCIIINTEMRNARAKLAIIPNMKILANQFVQCSIIMS